MFQTEVSKTGFFKDEDIARIQFAGAGEISDRVLPAGLTPVHCGKVGVKLARIRQKPASEFKLSTGTLVIAISMISVSSFLQMNLAGVRPDLFGTLKSAICLFAPRVRVIEATPVNIEIDFAEQTIREQEIRITLHRFFQEPDAFK